MLSDQQIEALSHGCAKCGVPFADGHRISTAYLVRDIKSFEKQAELGIVGSSARNYWMHVECDDPVLRTGYTLNPTIHHCIKCRSWLARKDVVLPVFLVVDPDATNPSDPTDKGIALNDRIYFMHADCRNKRLEDDNRSPIVKL